MVTDIAYAHQKMRKEVVRLGFDGITTIYTGEQYHGLQQLCKPQMLQEL